MANLRWLINENGEKVLQYRQFILGQGESWDNVPIYNTSSEHVFKENADGNNCLECGQDITHHSHKRNAGQICDTDDGPCSCGAWHKSKNFLSALLNVKSYITKQPGFSTNTDFVQILNIINPHVFDYVEIDFTAASTRKFKPLTDFIEQSPSPVDAEKERAIAILIAVNRLIDDFPYSKDSVILSNIKTIIKDYSK